MGNPRMEAHTWNQVLSNAHGRRCFSPETSCHATCETNCLGPGPLSVLLMSDANLRRTQAGCKPEPRQNPPPAPPSSGGNMNVNWPCPKYDYEPEWRWPWWKSELEPNALFTMLHQRINTRSCAIQDPRAFLHDVREYDLEAADFDQQYSKLCSPAVIHRDP